MHVGVVSDGREAVQKVFSTRVMFARLIWFMFANGQPPPSVLYTLTGGVCLSQTVRVTDRECYFCAWCTMECRRNVLQQDGCDMSS